jgi:cobyric acid synthase
MSCTTVLYIVDGKHLFTQLFELLSIKTLNICGGLQALGRLIRVGFFTLL